jgi:hypothetical protein
MDLGPLAVELGLGDIARVCKAGRVFEAGGRVASIGGMKGMATLLS